MIHDIEGEFDQTVKAEPPEETMSPEAPPSLPAGRMPHPLDRREHEPLKYHIEKEPPTAIVIHCGDSRFQKAFRSFIEEELGIEHYVPIVVLGGIHSLGFKDLLPKHYKALFDQLKHLIKERGIRRVVIINHEDCQWYERFSSWVLRRIPLPQKQVEDLRTAAESLLEHFAKIDVETYYAELAGDDVQFKRIS
jgi:hypothetical protein